MIAMAVLSGASQKATVSPPDRASAGAGMLMPKRNLHPLRVADPGTVATSDGNNVCIVEDAAGDPHVIRAPTSARTSYSSRCTTWR
jgi:hypothetical protein